MMYYHIDLTARKPTISEYFGETLKNDLKRENLKNPLDLSCHEFKVFKDLDSAVNYYNLYYDSNIHTYSPGNMLHNFEKMWSTYRQQARQLEFNYGRVNADGTPAIGDVNDD